MGSSLCRTLAIFLLTIALVGALFPQSTAPALAKPNQALDIAFGVRVTPSSVVIKVAEKVNVTITLTNAGAAGSVCFSLEGFPESGFRTSFSPECAIPQATGKASVLTVEATPAAAPQSFTAFIIARNDIQTAQTPFTVTVEPAMPAWVPWLGLMLFFLVLGIAVIWKPKLSKGQKSSKRKD